MLVAHDGGGDARDSHGDAVIGRALALDDRVGARAHILLDLRQQRRAVGLAAQREAVRQVDARDVRAAEDGQLAVAVFADDDRVNAAAVHAQLLAQQLLEARAVEHRARADDARGRIAGQTLRLAGQNVDRVGDDQQDARKGRRAQ